MIVTSEPKRWKIEANSQPMMPPPRTTSRSGTSVAASRPVESTQRGESIPSIGGRSGNEPVATIAERKVTSSPPSTAIVFASRNVPLPLTHSTPFALKSDATPHVICLTTPFFHAIAVSKSSCGCADHDSELRERLLRLVDARTPSAPTPSSGCSPRGGRCRRAPAPARRTRSSRRAARRGSLRCTRRAPRPGRRRHIPSGFSSSVGGRRRCYRRSHRPGVRRPRRRPGSRGARRACGRGCPARR